MTAASLHDSHVALPLIKLTSERVDYLYDLMDTAYDAQPIYQVSRSLGHLPIIDKAVCPGPAQRGSICRIEGRKGRFHCLKLPIPCRYLKLIGKFFEFCKRLDIKPTDLSKTVVTLKLIPAQPKPALSKADRPTKGHKIRQHRISKICTLA